MIITTVMVIHHRQPVAQHCINFNTITLLRTSVP